MHCPKDAIFTLIAAEEQSSHQTSSRTLTGGQAHPKKVGMACAGCSDRQGVGAEVTHQGLGLQDTAAGLGTGRADSRD